MYLKTQNIELLDMDLFFITLETHINSHLESRESARVVSVDCYILKYS